MTNRRKEQSCPRCESIGRQFYDWAQSSTSAPAVAAQAVVQMIDRIPVTDQDAAILINVLIKYAGKSGFKVAKGTPRRCAGTRRPHV